MDQHKIREPEKQLADYLEDALEQAETYARSNMRRDDFDIAAALALTLINERVGIVAREQDEFGVIRETQPGADPERLRENLRGLDQDPQSWPPWTRFVVELTLVERGIDRSLEALNRYGRMRALVTGRNLPSDAWSYVDQIVDAYLFGFDSAVVALTSACFEILAKRALIATRSMTDRELDREKPGAEGLRIKLRQAGLLTDNASAGLVNLIARRNSLLHGGKNELNSPDAGLDAIKTLIEVCENLQPSWPTPKEKR
jgi:hypothetical protein